MVAEDPEGHDRWSDDAAPGETLAEAARGRPVHGERGQAAGTGYVGLWLDLVRVPPSGTWERRRADLLAAAQDWIGPDDATEAQGLERLVQRYLGAFGPAAPTDIASWSGVRARHLVPVLECLLLRRFRDERGGELVELPRQTLLGPETPSPVRFLPV